MASPSALIARWATSVPAADGRPRDAAQEALVHRPVSMRASRVLQARVSQQLMRHSVCRVTKGRTAPRAQARRCRAMKAHTQVQPTWGAQLSATGALLDRFVRLAPPMQHHVRPVLSPVLLVRVAVHLAMPARIRMRRGQQRAKYACLVGSVQQAHQWSCRQTASQALTVT